MISAIQTEFFQKVITLIPEGLVNSDIYFKYIKYLPILLIGFLVTFLLTPIIGAIANRNDITYKPLQSRKNKEFDNPLKAIHDKVTPSMGGIAITIPFLIFFLLSFSLDSLTIPILIAVIILIIGSILDDVLNLDSKIQFGYQILAAVIIALSVLNLSDISLFSDLPINLNIKTFNFNISDLKLAFTFPGDLILIGWLILCINAYKWVGGSPGLIESNSLITFLLIFVIGIRHDSLFSSANSIFLTGSLIAFFIFAFPPEKIMSGSSGKTLYGFLIAVLSLTSGAKFATTLLLLLLPIVDAIFVLIRRMIVYKPKGFLALMKINDPTHLHHQFLRLNLSKRQVLLVESLATLLIGSLAVLSTGAMKYFGLIVGLILILGAISIINISASRKEKEATAGKIEKDSPEKKYSY